jgi:Carbohydrate-selective porin, OprB family
MWRRLSVLPTVLPLIGLTVMVDVVRAADAPDMQRLLERLRALEERLNKLEGGEASKKPVEYVCPRGVILKEPPPNGRCPDGTPPQVREAGEAVRAADTPDMQRLLERLRALEERMDRLDRVEVVKKTIEYVCPGGEILDQPPPGGRCPDGKSAPQVRETVRTSSVARRESISDKIEAAIADAEAKKVAIGGSARGALQQVLNADKGDNKLFGQGAVDLTLVYQPMVRTTLFVDLEAIGGPGPDDVLGSLSRLNADAETLGGQDEKLTVREAWLGLRFVNDRLETFAGKLDPTNYFDRNAFANDETSQFLNAALVNNPMLKQPANGPGLVGRWDAGRDFGFSLGVHATNDLDDDLLNGPFVIAELDYHSSRFIGGNYRLWARVSTIQEDDDPLTWGVGVSLDQLLTPRFGVFVRAGFSQTEDVGLTSYAVSAGIGWTSPLGERPKDRLGVGYSFQHEAPGDEHLIEAYYNLFLTDHLSVIGNVQWLIYGPNQETGKTNHHIVVPGLRGIVGF